MEFLTSICKRMILKENGQNIMTLMTFLGKMAWVLNILCQNFIAYITSLWNVRSKFLLRSWLSTSQESKFDKRWVSTGHVWLRLFWQISTLWSSKKSLKKLKGDGAVGVTCRGKDIDILVVQGDRYVPPMCRGNSRPFQPGLGRDRGNSRPFVVNRPGFDGKPMRCRGCESIGHLTHDCPHVGSRPQAHFADVDDNADFYEEPICLFSVQESSLFLAEA